MFVDASVLVAILANEADSGLLLQKLKSKKRRLISPIAVFEASLAMRRLHNMSSLDAFNLISEFIKLFGIIEVSIEPRIAEIALKAFERFGKGQHRTSLNMGDCFAFACAKAHKVPLLCKGNDFTQTDISLL
jgi:ribonuclease VapC